MNKYKTKKDNINTAKKYRYFFESNFVEVGRLFVLICSNQHENFKRYKARRYYSSKSIIKNFTIIINGKNLYDHSIDSGGKRDKEIRKLYDRMFVGLLIHQKSF